jgi:hypothetical protein
MRPTNLTNTGLSPAVTIPVSPVLLLLLLCLNVPSLKKANLVLTSKNLSASHNIGATARGRISTHTTQSHVTDSKPSLVVSLSRHHSSCQSLASWIPGKLITTTSSITKSYNTSHRSGKETSPNRVLTNYNLKTIAFVTFIKKDGC